MSERASEQVHATAAGPFEKSFDKRGRPNWESVSIHLVILVSLAKETQLGIGLFVRLNQGLRPAGDISLCSHHDMFVTRDFLDWNSRTDNP